jgi:hypothetical protein
MYVKKRSSSMKQMAYARRLLGAQGTSKKEIALDVGYSPNVANSISSHIENKPGFNNAMARLAVDSNNLALAAMHEFKARGFKDFSNKDLIGALNAIGSAWSKFNATPGDMEKKPSQNKLRTVILQQVENQTVVGGELEKKEKVVEGEVAGEDEGELDF